MCLILNESLTERMRKKKGGKIRAWKVLTFHDNELLSPMSFYPLTYLPGEIVARRGGRPVKASTSKYERERGEIYDGIHVFLTRTGAKKLTTPDRNRFIVPVVCSAADLRAAGTFSDNGAPNAVFAKVQLLKKDYIAAIRAGRKL